MQSFHAPVHGGGQLGKLGQFAQTWTHCRAHAEAQLHPALDRFVAVKIKTGLYASANQGLRAALRFLELNEREREEKWQRFAPQLKLESPMSSIQVGEV